MRSRDKRRREEKVRTRGDWEEREEKKKRSRYGTREELGQLSQKRNSKTPVPQIMDAKRKSVW